MDRTEFERLHHHTQGRIEVIEALNDYLGRHPGFLGFISWWGIHKFILQQLEINARLIKQRQDYVDERMRGM